MHFDYFTGIKFNIYKTSLCCNKMFLLEFIYIYDWTQFYCRHQIKDSDYGGGEDQYPTAKYSSAPLREPSVTYALADNGSVKYSVPVDSKISQTPLDTRGNDYYRTWELQLQRSTTPNHDVITADNDVGSSTAMCLHDTMRYNSFHFRRDHGLIVEHIYESPRFNRKKQIP